MTGFLENWKESEVKNKEKFDGAKDKVDSIYIIFKSKIGVKEMNKNKKNIILFTISFFVAFFIVGYFISTSIVGIDWVADTTIFDKFREFYSRNIFSNIIISIIIAGIATIVINLIGIKNVN